MEGDVANSPGPAAPQGEPDAARGGEAVNVVKPRDPRARIVRARQSRFRAGAPRAEGEGAGEAEVLQRRVIRLEEELRSLRDAYAKKISRTELWAEQLQWEKDAERTKWYKQQEEEMERMRAAAKIMHSLFELKYTRSRQQVERDREEARRKQEEQEAALKRLEEAHAQELARCAAELEQAKAAYEKSIERHIGVQDALKEELAEVRRKLTQAEEEIASKQEECRQHEREIGILKKKLESTGGSREDEIARWEKQIRALEEELKRVKKVMTQRRLEEGEKLRKELMEYVKFIVHILPDNWKAYAAQGLDDQELSPELKHQLREACGADQSGGGPKGYKSAGHVHPPHPAGAAPLPPLGPGSPAARTPRPYGDSPSAKPSSPGRSPYGTGAGPRRQQHTPRRASPR